MYVIKLQHAFSVKNVKIVDTLQQGVEYIENLPNAKVTYGELDTVNDSYDALVSNGDIYCVEPFLGTTRLFLDDERFPPQRWENDSFVYIARSVDEAIDIMKNNKINFVSFDHDLGSELSGYDFAKWLVEYFMDNGIPNGFEYEVHSMNPIGAQNIRCLLNNFFEKMNE